MLLDKKDGISCDICGAIYTNDFTYYSYDLRKTQVIDNTMNRINYKKHPDLSIDICQPCHTKFTDLIKKYYRPTPCLPDRRYNQGIYCELTGTHMKGTYSFYHVNVTNATVTMSHKPYVCTDCNKAIKDENKECPSCGGLNFAKSADVKSDDRYLEFWICEVAFTHLKPKKRQGAGEWSSSTN